MQLDRLLKTAIKFMVPTTLLKSISMTFPDQINAFPWLLLYVQCPKNPKVGAQIYAEGERSGQGYFPPSEGRGPLLGSDGYWAGGRYRQAVTGEGAVPPPQKIFEIFAWKWRILVAFFAIHEIFHLSCLFLQLKNFFPKTNG